jgi:hypothetical protein
MKLGFSRQTFEKYSNLMKIRPVETEVSHADRRTDGRTDMTKLTAAFRNFSNASKKKETHQEKKNKEGERKKGKRNFKLRTATNDNGPSGRVF